MERRRWIKLRQFMLSFRIWKPMWSGSLIMVPRNRIISLIWNFIDNKCQLTRREFFRKKRKKQLEKISMLQNNIGDHDIELLEDLKPFRDRANKEI
jgi:hypothetical protein